LGVPDEVEDATNEYRAEMDILNDFISDRCITGPGVTATAKVLYEEYEGWAEDNGEKAISKKLFGIKLGERGFESYRATGGVRTWRGIGVTRDT
jgi:putative DNA primase/helicase